MPSPKTPGVEDVLRGPIKSKTLFPVLILHFLDGGPDHGYGLMQRIQTICAGLLAVNTNTIYPLLRRLEEREFISGAWEHPTKRSRRIYSITPAGKERLARIKSNMRPYLDVISATLDRLNEELYHEQLSRTVA